MNPLYEKEPITGEEAGKFWQDRFDRAYSYRKRHKNGDKAWKRYLKLYVGDHWQNSDDDNITSDMAREKVTVNITGSAVLNMLPFLVRKRPKFIAKPKREKFTVTADLQESILNYAWKEYDMQKQLRAAALDGIIFGHAIIKTGFTLELNESYKLPSTGRIEYRDYIKKQAPWIRRVSPFNIVYDPEAPEHDIDSARWIAEIFYLPIQDIIENERYSAKAKKAIKEGHFEPTRVESLMREDEGDNIFLKDNGSEYGDLTNIVCFELWDKRSGKYFVFAHGCHVPLIEKEEWPYDYLEGFPFDRYEFIPVPEDNYALGLPKSIEDQQLELNRIRTSLFQHRRRFNRKYTAVETDIKPDQLEKLESGEDGTIILVEDHDAIKPIQDATVSSDEYNIEAIIKDDIRELTGSDELARGGSLPSRTTATEVQARTKLYGLKLEDRVEQFDRFSERIGRKVIQHMKANWVAEDVVRISGPQGYFWKTWTREDIQGEVDIEVEATSTEVVDEVTERQQAIQILQIMTANAQLLMQMNVNITWEELFKWVLSKFESMKEVQRWFPAAGVINQPIEKMNAPVQPGGNVIPGPGMRAGGFNPQGIPARTPAVATPPNPANQAAQPGGGQEVLKGLMGALG